MQGVNNALALKHVPEVVPREDTLAGPKGRRGDQVLGPARVVCVWTHKGAQWPRQDETAALQYIASVIEQLMKGYLQVGGFILMHKTDLKRMAPLWLKYSEDVRFDPDVGRALPCVCTVLAVHRWSLLPTWLRSEQGCRRAVPLKCCRHGT